MRTKKKRPQVRAQSLQVSVRLKVPKGVQVAPKVIQEAIHKFTETGELPNGFEISMIVWHKEYANGRSKDYSYDSDGEFPAVLDAARRAGIIPKVFSRVSE